MQKKLIAAAIASALAVPAFAQSNVTINGQFKVHFDSVSAGGATAAGTSLTSRNRFTDNNSWLRFSGQEDLGGGNAAIFQIESALGTTDCSGTTGAANNACATDTTGLGTRDTWVGMKGNWGMFQMGKLSLHYSSMAAIDGAGLADGLPLPTSHLSILHGNGQGAATGIGTRFNNSAAYTTPSFNGFSARLAYSTMTESTTANLPAKSNMWNLQPQYINGPIAVVYSYEANNNVGDDPNASQRGNRLGGAYTFPMGLKVGLIWDRNKNTSTTNVTSTRTAWALPVSYTTGPHTVNFSYARAGDISYSDSTSGTDTNAHMWMLGYTYAMSKRTNVNVSWTQITNAPNAKYDFWHPSSSVGGSVTDSAIAAGADPRMFAVGIMHAF